MVSAAKLKRATNAIVQLRPYAEKLKEILANVSASVEEGGSPYVVERKPNHILVVVVSSNRGLAGAFNANIVKKANQLIQTKYSEQYAAGNVSVIAIGKKGQDFFAKKPVNIIANYNDLYQSLDFENTSKITESIMKEFAEGKFDRVEVVYTQFRNAAVQFQRTEQLLPLVAESSQVEAVSDVDYIIEPSKEKIVEELIPKTIKIQLYKAVLDSHASEHGARMTAMDKATENAGELLQSLKLSYNQARQAAITTELTEIVSGAAALSNG